MDTPLLVHVLAGGLGLVAGFIALYSAKGAPLHRKAGMFFVVVMLTMTFTGSVIAAVRGAAPALNIPAGVTTAYLVVTGFLTVRPPARGARVLNLMAMGIGLGVGLVSLVFGLQAMANGGTREGMPAFPFFMFAAFGLLGSVGDFRMIRTGAPQGRTRIARHLWRMSFALFIAAMSFFLGQADVIPKPFRIMPLLLIPPFAVLGTMLYWVWRMRRKRPLPRMAGVAPEAV